MCFCNFFISSFKTSAGISDAESQKGINKDANGAIVYRDYLQVNSVQFVEWYTLLTVIYSMVFCVVVSEIYGRLHLFLLAG